MLTVDKITRSIKIDKELLNQMEIEEAMKIIKNIKSAAWESCGNRPRMSMPCLIGYSDGEVISGRYIHNPDFDRGGFFTSMKEFDPNNFGEPEYWMPLPQIPWKKRSKVA